MITKRLLRDWAVCHDDAVITAMARGRASASPREIAADETLTLDDRLWVVCHALGHRDEAGARTYAIDSAANVAHLAGRPEDCVEYARLVEDLRRIYAIPTGPEFENEREIWIAAMDTASAAAMDNAWFVIRSTVRVSAWNIAWHATVRDVVVAARSAARAAALEAARPAASAFSVALNAELRKAIDRAISALGPDAEGWTTARVEDMLRDIGHDHQPPADWQARVLATVKPLAPPPLDPRHLDPWFRSTMGNVSTRLTARPAVTALAGSCEPLSVAISHTDANEAGQLMVEFAALGMSADMSADTGSAKLFARVGAALMAAALRAK